ncbi:hypothetical protein G6F29_002966 [Rhizopus arrhizus]|nr:hypothetical protein G6F33_003608 [Rhizopus arrhizus]KAG0986832.1 hypothetical protein G6F29_002966 [Rhizopus arrhizus]KAG0999355.1 hypothetical protein G6F28_001095 [Rhizopus arrhizus]KAG1027705.1 hypothetical protein G6F26_003197 [Rhizopus arrhizus]
MSFSLYGSLPPSKFEKKSEAAKSTSETKTASTYSLYSSLPPPETSQSTTTTTTTTTIKEASTSTVIEAASLPTTAPTPKGWSAFNKFRPVLRRPTIQAKPKLNKPVIPVGATVVSVETVSKEKPNNANTSSITIQQETKAVDNIDLGAIPLLSTPDDVNGFRAVQKSKKKGKKKNATNNQPQPIVFNMLEDYDPHRPNDYEQYKEERRELREKQKRQRDWEKKQAYGRHSKSRSRSRSRSPSPEVTRYQDLRSHNKSSSPPPAIPAPASINLNETAEDAYQRRLRLSQQQSKPTEAPHSKLDDERLASAQDIARKVLAKYGWQEGQGLGRDGEGIKEALQVKPIGNGSGVIINKSAQVPIEHEKKDVIKEKASKTILLTNMVGPGEVDDMLQEETAEECSKYGKVERCLIFEVPRGQVPEHKAVRIFVKFSDVESAKRAIQDLNGRFFGGRSVSASYYDTKRFDKLDLAPTKDELLYL